MIVINEEVDTKRKASGAGLGHYLDAVYRSREAAENHPGFFDSDAHLDKVSEVASILKNFFGHWPNYYNQRGIGSHRPFESIKMCDVGKFLNRKTAAEKSKYLYEPLEALGVKYKSTNGHFLVSVY